MISLRKSVNEIERLGELQKTAAACYELALRAISAYAIEVDARETAEFRRRVDHLQAEWRGAGSPEKMREIHASVSGELRGYRDRAGARLERLRRDLEAAARAVETLTSGIAGSGADYGRRTEEELRRLEQLAGEESIEQMRRGIRAAVARIAASLEQMRRENQLAVAQLRDEIRLLHQARGSPRRAAPEVEILPRLKIDQQIEQLLARNAPFCLLFVNLRNLQRVQARHGRALVERAIEEAAARLQNAAGGAVGRWSAQCLAAIADPQPGGAMPLAREVTRRLSRLYTVQDGGAAHDIALDITVGTLDRACGEDPAAFAKKLLRLAAALDPA